MWFDFLKGVMVGFAIGWLVIASEFAIGVPHFDMFKMRYPHKGEARTFFKPSCWGNAFASP